MNELSHHFANACCAVLKERRHRLGLSQEALAARSGLARSYICDVERGARSPALFNLSLLAAGLETDTSLIIKDVELRLASELNFESLQIAEETGAPASGLSGIQGELLTYMLRRMKDGLMICNSAGRFVLINDVAREITGLPLMEMEPQEWSAKYGCLRPDRKTPYLLSDLPLYRALSGEWVDNAEMYLKNGTSPNALRHINITARPLKDDNGNVKGAAVLFHEIDQALPRTAG